MFSCNLPLLAEWLGSFTCYCGNTYIGGTNTEMSQHQKKKKKKKKPTLSPLLPGLEPETFRSQIRRSITEPSPLPTSGVICEGLCKGWIKKNFFYPVSEIVTILAELCSQY